MNSVYESIECIKIDEFKGTIYWRRTIFLNLVVFQHQRLGLAEHQIVWKIAW